LTLSLLRIDPSISQGAKIEIGNKNVITREIIAPNTS